MAKTITHQQAVTLFEFWAQVGRRTPGVPRGAEATRPGWGIKATIPVTLLGDDIVGGDWEFIEAGRWQHADPIMLGECRAVVRYADLLLRHPEAHNSVAASLEDNTVTSGAMQKGGARRLVQSTISADVKRHAH